MRKLIEFLFGGIIEEIALARADQIIEQMVEDHVGNMKSEVEDQVNSFVYDTECRMDELDGRIDDTEYRIDELESRADDVESEVSATKEEIDDMKGAA